MTEQEELLRKQILTEVAEKRAACAEAGVAFNFNNFFAHILDKKYEDGGYYRWLHKDKTKIMHSRSGLHAAAHSERAFSTTWQEFFEAVDEIMQRLEIQERFQELKDILEERTPNAAMTRVQARDAINELLEPIYVELRMMGFSDYDLEQ